MSSPKTAKDPAPRRSSGARKQIVRVMELSRRKHAPVKPQARLTHPRTGRIVLIGSFARGVPPFMRSVHSFLAEMALRAGFSLQLSAGEDPRELERAEGILITDPAWLTPERETELRNGKRGFVMLSTKQPGPNTVFLDASGAWIEFLLSAERRRTTRILFLETGTGEGIPALALPEPLRKTFSRKRQLPLFQALPKNIERPLSSLPPELMTDDTCLLTDDVETAISLSAVTSERSQKSGPRKRNDGFWTACMLPVWDAPALRNGGAFRADPEDTAREMLHILYRQMVTGRTSDPGAILPVLWSDGGMPAGRNTLN